MQLKNNLQSTAVACRTDKVKTAADNKPDVCNAMPFHEMLKKMKYNFPEHEFAETV